MSSVLFLLLLPRESSKSFGENDKAGRGGGDRTRDPRFVQFQCQSIFGPTQEADCSVRFRVSDTRRGT
jgi:hypothetical protein